MLIRLTCVEDSTSPHSQQSWDTTDAQKRTYCTYIQYVCTLETHYKELSYSKYLYRMIKFMCAQVNVLTVHESSTGYSEFLKCKDFQCLLALVVMRFHCTNSPYSDHLHEHHSRRKRSHAWRRPARGPCGRPWHTQSTRQCSLPAHKCSNGTCSREDRRNRDVHKNIAREHLCTYNCILYIRMYIHIRMYINIRMYIHTVHTYIYVLYVCTYIPYICTYIRMYILCMHVCI